MERVGRVGQGDAGGRGVPGAGAGRGIRDAAGSLQGLGAVGVAPASLVEESLGGLDSAGGDHPDQLEHWFGITVGEVFAAQPVGDRLRSHVQGAGERAPFDSGVQEPITGFVVRDSGVGFNDQNLRSFETLDSDYKSAQGCRGVGRLLWLKAFDKVEVRSRYTESGGVLKDREFTFTEANDVAYEPVSDSGEPVTGTEVRLLGFRPLYQQNAPKKTRPIAKAILEHCLWYFVRCARSAPVSTSLT